MTLDITRSNPNPWVPGDTVSATRCWACHKEFTATEPVKVVDIVVPKLVHDREPCASAMMQFVMGS